MSPRRSWLAELKSGAIGTNVVALGFTSFFTDISSEMVTAALPAYAILHLGLSPLEFGTLDGIQRGAALLVGVAIAFGADRGRNHKRLALAGYSVSALCKLVLFLAAGTKGALSWILLVDRAGKGLRSPARDALIAGSSSPGVLATAFGVHRALDAAGALLGPLAAFALLSAAPQAFDAVFVVSLCSACIGLACLALFVREEPVPGRAKATLREAFGLFLAPRFRALVVVALLLALATVSESFLYVTHQRRTDFAGDSIPLLFSATAVAQLLLTMPAARLADRVGRGRVFLAGQLCLLATYATLLLPATGNGGALLLVLCLGAFMAATDGVLMAMTSAIIPAELRVSGLAIVMAAIGAGRLVASIAFGALWSARGSSFAVWAFGAAILCLLPFAWLVLGRRDTQKMSEHAPAA